jgi:hypothetical protein
MTRNKQFIINFWVVQFRSNLLTCKMHRFWFILPKIISPIFYLLIEKSVSRTSFGKILTECRVTESSFPNLLSTKISFDRKKLASGLFDRRLPKKRTVARKFISPKVHFTERSIDRIFFRVKVIS